MTFINLRTPPKTKKTGSKEGRKQESGNFISQREMRFPQSPTPYNTHSYWIVTTEDLQSPGATKLMNEEDRNPWMVVNKKGRATYSMSVLEVCIYM